MTEAESTTVALRRATPHDASAVADVFLAAFYGTYDFRLAHSDEEVRGWVAENLVPTQETWVAEDTDGRIVAIMALGGDDELEQLYVDPSHLGRGIGSAFVALAKQRRPGGLDLYTFQVNSRARSFYEKHGFVLVDLNDGSRNEEKQPDVRYHWQP